MHDLQLQRFYTSEVINGQNNAAEGPIKTFTLRGIKDSPPYLHDGRLLTLEDTVEFFNLVLQLKLSSEEKPVEEKPVAGGVYAGVIKAVPAQQ